MIVKTETGSIYEINLRGLTVRRVNSNTELRGDEEWLKMLCAPPVIKVGLSMQLTLEPLDPDADFTFRITSRVTEIIDPSPGV